MTLIWWKKGLWQMFIHHWTVHAKVEFQKFLMGFHSHSHFPPDVRSWGSIPWNGPIHNIWHFSCFTVCITIGISDKRPIKQSARSIDYNKYIGTTYILNMVSGFVWIFALLDWLFLCFLPCQEKRTVFHSSLQAENYFGLVLFKPEVCNSFVTLF